MTGHLRLYWIRTSCKRYKYERHFYGKIIKKDIIINRLPVVIYFILIFAALMVIISAVAPMSNHEPKTTDTYSDFSTGWLNCEESEASLNHLSGTTVIHRTITAADCNKTLFFFCKNIKYQGVHRWGMPIQEQSFLFTVFWKDTRGSFCKCTYPCKK